MCFRLCEHGSRKGPCESRSHFVQGASNAVALCDSVSAQSLGPPGPCLLDPPAKRPSVPMATTQSVRGGYAFSSAAYFCCLCLSASCMLPPTMVRSQQVREPEVPVGPVSSTQSPGRSVNPSTICRSWTCACMPQAQAIRVRTITTALCLRVNPISRL